MTMMQYVGTFRFYGIEVLLLALGVTVVSSVLKKTLLKNVRNKFYAFLPFALGIVFYAVFRMIVTASILPLTKEAGATVNGGFACGCASTLYYVVWEQYFSDRQTTPPYPLLFGYVKEEERASIAAELYKGAEGLSAENLLPFIEETLEKYFLESVTDCERKALCALMAQYLLSLRN